MTARADVEALPIQYTAPLITEKAVTDFRKAIGATSDREIPSTFATCYRQAEFLWLDRKGLTLQHLLHAEQEYEYLRALQVGETPLISTYLENFKERKMGGGRMIVLDLRTEITVEKDLKTIARTKFIVREPAPGGAG